MALRKSRMIRAGVGFCLGLGFAWLACGLARADTPRGIDWRSDLSSAQAEARAVNRPLWIQFTGPWCHNCHRMERESFIHPKVVGRAQSSFVPVLLQSDVHEELALHYGVTGLPATVIVRPSGEVVAKHEGFVDAGTFDAFLASALFQMGPERVPETATTARLEEAVALGGYCPVSLVNAHRLVPGARGLAVVRDGRVYRFAGMAERDAFRKQPERYIPVNGGRCPVTQVDRGESPPGDPRWGVLYQGHLYLCANELARTQFLKNPQRYAQIDVADRGFCPHCWNRDHLLVRGRPQYSLIHGGRRYLFPNPDHLEAFRADFETIRR